MEHTGIAMTIVRWQQRIFAEMDIWQEVNNATVEQC